MSRKILVCGALLTVLLVGVEGTLRGRHAGNSDFAARPKSKPSLPAEPDEGARLSQQCQNGQYCDGGASCCNGGSSCCPSGTACCGDVCCNNGTSYKAEACCPDPKNGGVCCLVENTYCCPPNPAIDQPSRCCPRWYVCCAKGRFGCCDPTTGAPMEEAQAGRNWPQVATPRRFPPHAGNKKKTAQAPWGTSAAAAPPMARAIFEEESIWTAETNLYGQGINLITGAVSPRTKLPRGVFHTEQEMTRLFAYAPELDLFFLPQANFTDPALEFPVTLYTFDGTNGAVRKAPITGGVRDEVTGFYWSREKGVLLMATAQKRAAAATASGKAYEFFSVNVSTAVATRLSALSIPAGAADSFGGWFHEASHDLRYLYRVGYEEVATSSNFGLGIVDISAKNATQLPWVPLEDPAGGFGRLRSLHRVRNPSSDTGSGAFNVTFVSLAQGQNVSDFLDLGVFTWAPTAKGAANMRRLTVLPDAHLTEYFGPIAEATDPTRTKYAALVVQDSPLGSTENSWALATVDLIDGGSNVLPLSPTVLSSIDSLSGFGVPFTQPSDGV